MSGRRRVLALDSWVTEFADGRVFQPEGVQQMRAELLPMALPWLRLAEQARRQGYELATADQVEQGRAVPGQAILLSHDWTPRGEHLLARGVRPGVVLTFEPPVIAWSFYYHLREITARFPHAFVFHGARGRVAPSTSYHELRFPQLRPARSPEHVPWEERRFLAMVNTGKMLVRSPRYLFERPREMSLRRELAALRYRPIGRDLYGERLRAIRYFSSVPGFDLYGVGWEERHRAMSPAAYRAARLVYRGPLSNKLDTLAGYRFALCLENTRFPGYVSEKLFDCLFAGCIPVYEGAPDIERYVPSDCFVDVSRFGSYGEVHRFLLSLGPEDARRYLEAGRAYLESAGFKQFAVETFVYQVLEAVKTVS